MNAFEDSRLKFNIFDSALKSTKRVYEAMYTYNRLDGSRSSVTLQFRHNFIPTLASDLPFGNTKKDLFFLLLSGIDSVTFGNKDRKKCLQSAQIGVMRYDGTDYDHTPCVGWLKDVGVARTN